MHGPFLSAEQDRVTFLSVSDGVPTVKRNSVFADVLSMYQTNLPQLLQGYPFRVNSVGERAIDAERVSREMYSGFFLFDGFCVLLSIQKWILPYSLPWEL